MNSAGTNVAAGAGTLHGFQRDHPAVVFEYSGPRPTGELAIVSTDGEALPEPVRSTEIREKDDHWSAVFDGWQAIRYLAPREKETTFRVELRDEKEGSRCFSGNLVLKLDDRRED